MKNILFIVFTLFAVVPLIAQEPTDYEDNKIYRFVQQKAEPQEGMEKFQEDFVNQLDVSSLPKDNDKVLIRLRSVVEKDGSFSDSKAGLYTVKNDSIAPVMNDKFSEEVIRLSNTMPKWKPAIHEGEIVRSVYDISMVVKMRDRVEEEIREFTEQKAEPVDGMVQFLSDYRRRFRMPDGIPSDVKQLSVRLKFVIEKDGTLSDIQALNNDYGVGNEGIRVLKSMPKWKPAMQDGVPVRSSFTWHYNFIVNNKL